MAHICRQCSRHVCTLWGRRGQSCYDLFALALRAALRHAPGPTMGAHIAARGVATCHPRTRPTQVGWRTRALEGTIMSTRSVTTSKLAVESPKFVLRTLLIVVLFASCSNVSGQLTSHVRVTPGFPWPQSQDGLASANRTPRPQLQAFLEAVWKGRAGGSCQHRDKRKPKSSV